MTTSPHAVPEPASRSANTKERLLDAAEHLFGELGFEGASLRAVTQAAGTSLSAANYHFGSKEALLRASLARRVEPLNARRIARLDELERRGGIEIAALVEAYLRPVFELRAERRASGVTGPSAAIVARLFADPPAIVAELRRELFGPVQARFIEAMRRALPQVSGAELELALHLTTGVMVHLLSGMLPSQLSPDASALDPNAEDFEPLLTRIVAFASGGVAALVSESAVRNPEGEER